MTAVLLALVLLNPVRLYFQPNQPVIVQLETKAIAQHLHAQNQDNASDAKTNSVLKLVLLNHEGHRFADYTLKPDAKEVDLAVAFGAQRKLGADLWDGSTYYIQLVQLVGSKKETPIGSPLVVVPLFPPGRNNLGPVNALRIYPEKIVELQTTQGSMGIRLDPKAAPATTHMFSQLAQDGFYTNVIFHRIIPGFMIQGGDPTGDGTGGPGFYTDLEPSSKQHTRGTLSMARQGGDVNTAGSQFFICLSRQTCAPLDRQYTAFGDLVWGMDVMEKIAQLPQAQGPANRPVNPPVILKAQLLPAPPRPIGQQPPAELPSPSTKEQR